MGSSRRAKAGAVAVVVAVLAAGGSWWWLASRDPSPPEAPPVACTDRGLTGGLAEADGPGVDGLLAPTAARAEPAFHSTIDVRGSEFDYQPPPPDGSVRDVGYALDPVSATLSYRWGEAAGGSVIWTTTLHDAPLHELMSTIAPLSGYGNLLVVQARQADDAASTLAIVDTDGTVQLSCSLAGGAGGADLVDSVLVPDGSTLLVPSVDAAERPWTTAHATDGGRHLWSAPGRVEAADDHRAYLVDDPRITARDLETGEDAWSREVAWNFQDASTGTGPAGSEPETWTLAVVDDELYVHPHGSRRLVVLDTRAGRTTWDLALGDNPAGLRAIHRLDEDGTVLLDFGYDLVVRRDLHTWSWVRRGLERLTVDVVPRRAGEPTLIVARPGDQDGSLFSVHSADSPDEPLFELAGRSEDYDVAAADTAVYVLDRTDRTVTAYDLESAEELWTVRTPQPQGSGPQPFRAAAGGFTAALGDGTAAYYRD